MSKFRAAPNLQQSENAFVQAAESPRNTSELRTATASPPKKTAKAAKPTKPASIAVLQSADAVEQPWVLHDAADKQVVSNQPLRLNAYQYEQLKWLAESQDRSLAQILRRLVGPALEAAVNGDDR